MDGGTRRSFARLAAATAAALATVPASADPVPLSEMLANRTAMVAGNTRIVFDAFYSNSFNPDEIMVTIIDRGDGGQGFRLEHLFGDSVAGDDSPSDFSLLFSAEGMNGNTIVGDNVAMEAQAQQNGSYIHLNDNVFNGGDESLIYRTLSVHATDGFDPRYVDNEHGYDDDGYGALQLHQDGWFFAAQGGFANATAMERTFVTAPLPSAGLLGFFGLTAVAARRRTRT